jgi:hypothetical protein
MQKERSTTKCIREHFCMTGEQRRGRRGGVMMQDTDMQTEDSLSGVSVE